MVDRPDMPVDYRRCKYYHEAGFCDRCEDMLECDGKILGVCRFQEDRPTDPPYTQAQLDFESNIENTTKAKK